MKKKSILFGALVLGAGGLAYAADEPGNPEPKLRKIYDESVRYTDAVDFPQRLQGDVVLGRAQFGLAAGSNEIDRSQALFQGNSVIAGQVTSNQTVCADCHNPSFNWLPPPLPISEHLSADNPLLTGRNAEAQGDPRMPALFDQHGLVKHRVGRFNPVRDPSSAFRRVFGWRKTQTLLNFTLGFGGLNDGRARHSIDVVRGALFTHTQDGDARFDDLVAPALSNIGAFQETIFEPPELKAMVDPNDPQHDAMIEDPFYTVHPTNALEQQGQAVFEHRCTGCHNMPNSFGNRDHVAGPPQNFMPLYGHTFDIGVAQANRLGLDFRGYDSQTGTFEPIVLPLTREDGKIVNVTVVDDVGAAGATGRYEDLHRFKVPQLRKIKDLGPYFHDNSAATLEEVVDYFNSDAYNMSADGKKYPVHLEPEDRAALLAFLRIL